MPQWHLVFRPSQSLSGADCGCVGRRPGLTIDLHEVGITDSSGSSLNGLLGAAESWESGLWRNYLRGTGNRAPDHSFSQQHAAETAPLYKGSGKRMCPRYYPIKVSYERTCFPSGSVVRNLTAMQETIPGWGRYPGGGNGHPLQYSCLENPIDRGDWQARVHGIARVRHNLATKPPSP